MAGDGGIELLLVYLIVIAAQENHIGSLQVVGHRWGAMPPPPPPPRRTPPGAPADSRAAPRRPAMYF